MDPSGSGGRGIGRLALLVGAAVGLVTGAVGFVALAPADSQAADGRAPADESEPPAVTVTTSPGADGTEGGAAAEGQASTPEEQAIYDLFTAISEGDCPGVIAASRPSYWDELFQTGDESEALSACETTFGTGQASEVRVDSTSILRSEDEQTVVTARIIGWHEDEFRVRNEDDRWVVAYSTRSLEGPPDGGDEGSESGGADQARENPSGRPLADPSDPPTGNPTFDELARNCHEGLMVACDDLTWVAPRDSEYELYGITCGGRRLGVFAGGHCERDFNRNVEE